MKKIITWYLLFLLLPCCLGCAVTSQRTFSVSEREDRVFAAALQAVTESGFGITQSNKAEGFISGSQGVVMGEHSTIMSVMTKKEGQGSQVSVTVVPPPGTVGNTAAMVEQFERNLRNSLSAK